MSSELSLAQSPESESSARRHLRVPRDDHSLLILPDISQAERLARSNHKALTPAVMVIAGRSLAELRNRCRSEVLRAARHWTEAKTGDAVSFDLDAVSGTGGPLLLATGHQPELFHPGVWIKHLAVAELVARSVASHSKTSGPVVIGLNLIVDNDTMNGSRIRVPVGSREQPRFELIDFDAPQSVRPWEEARIVNRSRFESFGERVEERMRRWSLQPLVSELWPDAIAASHNSDRLADCLSAARMKWERRNGLGNLELPMSRLAELDSFREFAAHLLSRPVEVASVYNAAVRSYRKLNRIRSATHPVPELQTSGEWIEAPFWIWKAGDTQRGRLFVRRQLNEWQLAAQPSGPIIGSLTSSSSNDRHDAAQADLTTAVAALRSLSEQGWKLRTRALTTTLFARLFLSDLFVHGIGGAHYDAMTDELMRKLFGIEPPAFLTLSATEWLPFAEPFDVASSDAARLRQQLRDVSQNPQRWLRPEDIAAFGSAQELLAEKRKLLAGSSDSMSSRPGLERYRRMPVLNRELTKLTLAARQRLEEQLRACEAQLAANDVLRNREFSFCLYPAEQIHRMLAGLRSRLD